MATKLKNAPVYFAIAQIRYNSILSLETYLPQIQEKFRQMGYMDFKRVVSSLINLTMPSPALTEEVSSSQTTAPQIERSESYIFSNMKGTANFILNQNSLSYQSSNYEIFKAFSTALFQGLKIVGDTINLDFTERVGIRYLNAAVPLDGETLRQYLIPEVSGLYEKLEGKFIQTFSESITHIAPITTLVSRVIIRNDSLGFPPDLQPIGLKVDQRFLKINGHHAIIDTDAFSSERESFNLDRLEIALDALHDEVSKGFKAVITNYALSIWK